MGAQTWAQPGAFAWMGAAEPSVVDKVHGTGAADYAAPQWATKSSASATATADPGYTASRGVRGAGDSASAESPYADTLSSSSSSLGYAPSAYGRASRLDFEEPDIDSTGPSFASLKSALE